MHSCHTKKRFDFLFWGSLSVVFTGFIISISDIFSKYKYIHDFSNSCYDLIVTMWWGVLIAIIFVGLLSKVPRSLVMSVLGSKDGIGGILRATIAGLMLDLCSHGILLVGMKLYERGASLGQTMAFLIASPWNSLSITFILFALIGIKWTIIFILLSLIVALISGLIFEVLVRKNILPSNPNREEISEKFNFKSELKQFIKDNTWDLTSIKEMASLGIKESRIVMRWLLFGIVLAAALRTFVSADDFATYFGASFTGLLFTIGAATIIEVCSEGSAPIAADLLTRAKAPGNSFAFLMTGVSTDYTEIMSLKETTSSWKIALFLPLVTLPQIIIIAWFIG